MWKLTDTARRAQSNRARLDVRAVSLTRLILKRDFLPLIEKKSGCFKARWSILLLNFTLTDWDFDDVIQANVL